MFVIVKKKPFLSCSLQVFKRSFAVFLLFFCNFYNFRKIPTFRQDVTECLMPMSLVTFRNKCRQLRAFFYLIISATTYKIY